MAVLKICLEHVYAGRDREAKRAAIERFIASGGVA